MLWRAPLLHASRTARSTRCVLGVRVECSRPSELPLHCSRTEEQAFGQPYGFLVCPQLVRLSCCAAQKERGMRLLLSYCVMSSRLLLVVAATAISTYADGVGFNAVVSFSCSLSDTKKFCTVQFYTRIATSLLNENSRENMLPWQMSTI